MKKASDQLIKKRYTNDEKFRIMDYYHYNEHFPPKIERN